MEIILAPAREQYQLFLKRMAEIRRAQRDILARMTEQRESGRLEELRKSIGNHRD